MTQQKEPRWLMPLYVGMFLTLVAEVLAIAAFVIHPLTGA